jgi:AcrR family transcriptional regulator
MPGRKIPEEQRRESLLRAAFAVAAREGLAGVTARAVAAEAGVSSGLVFFHFHTVDALLAALLEWLLAHTFVAAERPAAGAVAETPTARMLAAVRRDLDALPRGRQRVELFFDYWVRGTRDPAVRETIRQALERYRAAFLPLAAAVVAAAPAGRYGPDPAAAAAGLATVAATFVEGCALRVVLDPGGFEVDAAMATLAALVWAPAAVA